MESMERGGINDWFALINVRMVELGLKGSMKI